MLLSSAGAVMVQIGRQCRQTATTASPEPSMAQSTKCAGRQFVCLDVHRDKQHILDQFVHLNYFDSILSFQINLRTAVWSLAHSIVVVESPACLESFDKLLVVCDQNQLEVNTVKV